ncbi:hypothetical protein [Longimicrobium sp.]|jgi:hypothetical protein|uniref:hypothetical protein n=1 Tax=Longimicrobium sp. TaxID=2029185 RepID=UPI002EDA71D1
MAERKQDVLELGPEPEDPPDRRGRKGWASGSRWRLAVVLVLILAVAFLSRGFWGSSPAELGGQSQGVEQVVVGETDLGSPEIQTVASGVPSNGYVTVVKNRLHCWLVVAGTGGMSVEVNCKKFKLLPKAVRKTAGACAVGVAGAFLGGAPLITGCFTASLGVIPWDKG